MATILFFYGEDTYRSGQKLRALRNRYIDQSLGDTNLSTLEGESLVYDDFVRQVQALPFLAKARLVIVRNLLTRGKKDLLDRVQSYLVKVPASTVLVFYEAGQPDQRTKLFKQLNQPRVAEKFPLLQGAELERWLASSAHERALELPAPLVRRLTELVGADLWRLANELDKLTAWQLGHPTTPLTQTMVEDLVHAEASADIFRMIEALAKKDSARALREFEELLKDGEAELYILSMIGYQFRTLLVAADAWERGVRSTVDLARVLKTPPFVVEKTMRIAKNYRATELTAIYRRLLDYDVSIKTGVLEPRIALELLIGELSTTATTKS